MLFSTTTTVTDAGGHSGSATTTCTIGTELQARDAYFAATGWNLYPASATGMCGKLSDVARTTYTGGAIVAGGLYENKIFTTDINLSGGGVTSAPAIFRNCEFRGTVGAPSANGALIRAWGNDHFPAEIWDSTLRPQTPHWMRNGILGHDVKLYRTEIDHCVDNLSTYNTTAGHTTDPSGVELYGVWMHDLWYELSPPVTGTNDGAHSDGIQIQGLAGLKMRGCVIDAFVAAECRPNFYGDSTSNSGIIIKPDVGDITGLDIQYNRFNGGRFTINVANDPPSRILTNIGTIANNVFGGDWGNQAAGTGALSMPAGVTGTFTGNTLAATGGPIVIGHNG